MYKEVSTGGITYKIINEQVHFLVIQQSTNKLWEFPKGNIERGETEQDCLKRELYEEIGEQTITVKEFFREELEYINPKKADNWNKKEIYYLVELSSERISLSDEHIDYRWVPFFEAEQLIQFENMIEIIRKAYSRIVHIHKPINERFNVALQKFIDIIMKKCSVEGFFVTGSYYGGNIKDYSDLDVFIVSAFSLTREKGTIVIDDIKISYFLNPINMTYHLLSSEFGEFKRPTAEMIYYSRGFHVSERIMDLQTLADKCLQSSTSDFLREEKKYYGWKLLDKKNSLDRSEFGNRKYLEQDLLTLMIDLFFRIHSHYKPHTKYVMNSIHSINKQFFELLEQYFQASVDNKKYLDQLYIYLTEKLQFKPEEYYTLSTVK